MTDRHLNDSNDLKTDAARTLLDAGWLYRDVVQVLGYEPTAITFEAPKEPPDRTFQIMRALQRASP